MDKVGDKIKIKMIKPEIPLVTSESLIPNEYSVKGNMLKFKCMKCGKMTTLTISGSMILNYKTIHCANCATNHINPTYLGDSSQ